MLTVLSPAKTLDWTERKDLSLSQPVFEADAVRLARSARQLSMRALQDLMHISPDLARLNRDRFRDFAEEPDGETLRAAVFAFAGDTYVGLEAKSLEEDALRYAQNHLRILSGLYGLLRPLDGIQAYRLEMGSRLKTRRGTNLYAYWGASLSKELNLQAEETNSNWLLNCASQEYFGAVDLKKLKLQVIMPKFLEERNGTAKTVGFFAKRARGALARYVMEHRITDPKDLGGFSYGGYEQRGAIDPDGGMVFARPYPALSA
ncbi:MAG: peroxide stress protein YaaA [Pseudomonadota bacterium]